MDFNTSDRRTFIKKSALAAGAVGLASNFAWGNTEPASQNPIPRWRGFNLLDYFSPYTFPDIEAHTTTEDHFKWMVDWGFDFVRLPMAYPRYITFNKKEKITPEEVHKFDEKVVDEIETLVAMAHKHGLHVSLNLHRAPGYCINAGFYEPFNLWKDKEAQDAFYFHWEMWAKRFKNVSSDKISFDLLNEPALREDMNDQHSKNSNVPGKLYREIAKNAADRIRSINPDRLIIADGNNVGNDIIPEIEDLNIAQSCRGYFPHYISHHKAPWTFKEPEKSPKPLWPGTMDDRYYSRDDLEKYYKPWIKLSKRGVGVHCGECGCWKQTPQDVFLAWFGDILDILTQNNIGYALWNFRGDFGILDSGRSDVAYQDWHGHKLDSRFLELLKKY